TFRKFLNEQGTLDQYSLILFVASSSQRLADLRLVCQFATEKSIPLFYIHSVGLYSHFSVQLPDAFPIVDTHPDPASTQDLRLLEPWPELTAFMEAKTVDLDALSDHDHGHVPYLLLLLRFLEDWKKLHGGEPPKDYKEKKEFKSLIESKARTGNAEGGEENFDEAAASVLKSLNKPSIPSGLKAIFDELETRSVYPDAANFWLIALAIMMFHVSFKCLPLSGGLPDMKAQSHDYIQLQNLYKTKARQDIDEVTKRIRANEEILKKPVPVAPQEIEAFCKGAAFVKLIKGQDLLVTVKTVDHNRISPMAQMLQDAYSYSLLPVYIAFLAYDAMYEEYNSTFTTESSTPLEGEEPSLEFLSSKAEAIISDVLAASSGGEAGDSDFRLETMKRVEPVLQELIRADGAELHNISALTGGMVAQEVIKVITKQYIPIDNTCVFDGIASKTEVFRI
ncbi:MAG: hypothetical protein Q9174_001378, partial [Haloplaca sp. 1 TL-2023]